ncbi:MAG TPA: DUF6460 domain-containing protein [Beijerinckiaceae bacterium]|nr:DUF6460 domain-containing protein [Beijerinckiaceae bacterium]
MSDSRVQQFLGGSPVSVLIKLVLLSLLVGVILAAFGFTPWSFLHYLRYLVHEIFGSGIEALYTMGGYIAAGAVLVVPLWLLIRLLARK